jgi:hypothetical protein
MVVLTNNQRIQSPIAQIATASFFVIRKKHRHKKDTVESWMKLLDNLITVINLNSV